MTDTTRRRYIGAVGATLVAGLAGCGSSGPDPEVTNVEVERSLLELVGGPATFIVEVLNNGAGGEVDVRVRVSDETEAEIASQGRRVTVGEGERREVSVEMEVPEGAASYDATAEPA